MKIRETVLHEWISEALDSNPLVVCKECGTDPSVKLDGDKIQISCSNCGCNTSKPIYNNYLYKSDFGKMFEDRASTWNSLNK